MSIENKRFSPVCVLHGKRMDEHICLYCCLCFKDLTPETCHVREDGVKEDVCEECAQQEKAYGRFLLLVMLRGRAMQLAQVIVNDKVNEGRELCRQAGIPEYALRELRKNSEKPGNTPTDQQ